jgi:UDP-N-acetylmuramoyl-tripeptide--D-alanyl-D-alanine ligase
LRGSKRQTLEFTSKAKLILALALIFFVLDVFGSIYLFSGSLQLGALLITLLAFPFYFVAANIILIPIDLYLKNRIISKAKAKMSQYSNLKIIAITGSMGKTTTKEFLHTILKKKFYVLATQGTKNTPL